MTDLERIALMRAEREVALIETLILHLDVSDLAKGRAISGLRRVRESICSFRSRYSLAPSSNLPKDRGATP